MLAREPTAEAFTAGPPPADPAAAPAAAPFVTGGLLKGFPAKPELELAFDHGVTTIFHLPGLCRALADDLQHLGDIKACFHAEVQAFA